MDPRLRDLQRRVTELLARCHEVACALERNPSRQQRGRFAKELQLIKEQTKSLDAEARLFVRSENAIRRPTWS